jgi:hypothetical protein
MKEDTKYATYGSMWEWQVVYKSVFMGPGKEGRGTCMTKLWANEYCV